MHRKSRNRLYTVILLIALIILLGVSLLLKTYKSYTDSIITSLDKKQSNLSVAVDRNIELLISHARNNLAYLAETADAVSAEDAWLMGDSSRLKALLHENLNEHDSFICDLAVIKDDIFIVSTFENKILTFIDIPGGESRICLDLDGKPFLAVIHRSHSGTEYAAIMDLELIYSTVSHAELAESDLMLLLDRSRKIMLHFCTHSRTIKSTLLSECPKREDFNLLYTADEQGQRGIEAFMYQTKQMDEGYNARIMMIPAGQSHNGSFSIGLISNTDKALAPLRAASFKWLASGAIIFIGLLMLIILVLRFARRETRIERELELLRQKNLSMEELNRKTREMAHHQRLEMMGTITSGIAHEFNNLITPIMGYSMLTLEKLPGDQEELYDYILEIYNSSRKAREITKQLSQYSHKNTSDIREPIDPTSIINEVLHVARPACPKTAEIVFDSVIINSFVVGNPTQLSQLFLNIMLNAFHALPEEGGRLEISVKLEYGQVAFTFSDNGCGIPRDVVEHIFEPFYTTKEGGRGTGLGLAIAQQIAEDHHGSISVSSKEGEGSTFTVRLPAHYR
ncbi:MAG: HAMP domain-containing histidine kinase [Clostridia bacterium]|nr:HAMP domain-containing histidine kinase [Clostridia bacterium]